MAPVPMREEFLAAEARLAADETDTPDHELLTRSAALEQLERDAVVDAQIGDAGPDIGTVVDLHRAFAAHGLCAAIDGVPPSGAGVLDGQAKMNIAGIRGRLRVRALVRR